MLNHHPKGLVVAFFTNMGERFGYYTMIAIFILFIQAKYGLNAAAAGQVYGIFLAAVYFCPIFGGLLADKVLGYGKTIGLGLIVMFLGYLLLAIPTVMGSGFILIIGALAVISIGTGLFKGNLQALVGNMYDDPRYSAHRDRGFNIFYMGINVGAMFAPTAAEKVSNWILATFHYTYDARIPALANDVLRNKPVDMTGYLQIARLQDPGVSAETLNAFSRHYLNALSQSYHLAFGVACISLVISMLVFWSFRKHYQAIDFTEKQKSKSDALKATVVDLPPHQTRERMVALGLVFLVVIFFWMSFHQNGAVMTYFARDYTVANVGKVTNLWFDLWGLLSIALSIAGLVIWLKKDSTKKLKTYGLVAAIAFGFLAVYRYLGYNDINPFTPQKFQHFNPFFIVVLTPLIVGFFGYLQKKGKEPSSPRKIGIGMLITAVSFTILIIGSLGLASPQQLGGRVAPAGMQVSTYWLISTYFMLTIAELFLSPMGISFVSRAAPPKYKGLMQGMWFAATAVGNYLLSVIASLWLKLPLWALWSVLVGCCLLSALFIFSVMRRLENATQH
ncbi:MAG: peptide MFS transporter [Candidatus Omnitrophota bacterium]